MFENFFSKVSLWAEAFVNLVVDIFNRFISWIKDVIDWFKKKIAGIKSRIACIITAKELKKILGKMGVGGLLSDPTIPTIKIPDLYGDDTKFEEGIVEVVYDENTDTIKDLRMIGGEGVDDNIKEAMKGTDIIKLG